MFNLPALRINALILLMAPFVTIGAIKATNLVVPDRYYFSISRAVNFTDQPFVMLQPTASGEQTCKIFRKYGIDTRQNAQQCQENEKTAVAGAAAFTMPVDVRDLAIRYGYQTDNTALTLIRSALSETSAPLTADALRAAVSQWHSHPEQKLRAIAEYYVKHLIGTHYSEQLDTIYKPLSRQIEQLNKSAGERPSSRSTYQPGNEQATFNVDKSLAIAAETLLALNPNELQAPNNLNLTAIETAKQVYDWPGFFKSYYIKQLEDQVFARIIKAVEEKQGVKPTRENLDRLIVKDITLSNISDYLISVILRIMPVVFTGIILGSIFGYAERFSIGFGVAFGALLLCWPIFFLWDSVVGAHWQESKPVFAVFYGVYIATFFITAYWGAKIGAWFSQTATARALAEPQRMRMPQQERVRS